MKGGEKKKKKKNSKKETEEKADSQGWGTGIGNTFRNGSQKQTTVIELEKPGNRSRKKKVGPQVN